MSNSQLAAWLLWPAMLAAWYMGVQVGLLQPMIGRKLRKAGVDRGTVDGHGVGITCSDIDGALRTCHSQPCAPAAAAHWCIAREARLVRAGVHVVVEVFGAFARALRDADLEKCEEYLRSQAFWPAETGSCPICRSAQTALCYELPEGHTLGSQPL
jgi:hypothetical protein